MAAFARTPSDGEAALLAALALSPAQGSVGARSIIEGAGLPTRRVESWRWSDLRQAMTADFAMPAPDHAHDPQHRQDGLHAPASDFIAQLAIGFGRGRFIRTAPGQTVISTEALEGEGLMDPRFTDIEVAEDATLIRVVTQTASGIALSSARVRLARGARYKQVVLAEGARLARIETHVSVEGEGAAVELNGVYMCGEGRHADLTSVIDHKVGGAQTRQLIKGVARKGGRGVFQGKIVVERGAQKTDARQHHHGLLLEEGAEIFAKPELMIHADDVQCAHGNAAGGLDENALFYMRSRGLPERDARALLIEAFLAEAIPADLPDALSDELLGRIRAWLRGVS